MPWLDPTELRIGLGCMRLPADERLALDTIRAACDAGVTVFDTARAYEGNERLLARALRGVEGARIVTKGGMTRPGGAWVADGRAKAIAADCEASLEALDGLPIDLYLLHAPDPRVPWSTSMRALTRLADQGLVRRVGLANVNRTQLDEALELAPIEAVQVALSPLDDLALRGGVLARCDELGIPLIAHSPLGGPRRAATLARRGGAEAALAWVLGLSEQIVAIPGASRPETARSSARAARLRVRPEATAPPPPRSRADGDVVLVMGIPGAGKSRVATGYVERGYVRLNRDERGGSLRALADALDEQLAAGVRRAVLDNTYLSRAERNRVVEAARRHSVAVRCIWIETPLAQAQVNLVERLVEHFRALPEPEEIRAAARREPWLMLPTSQMRALRELEPPAADEGFTAIERVPFAREPVAGGRSGVFVAAAAATREGFSDPDPSAPHLLFDWAPGGDAGALRDAAARLPGAVDVAVCPHAAGPPTCWCRPPLPGLPLAFAHARSVEPARSVLIGCTPTHRTLATTLGARYLPV